VFVFTLGLTEAWRSKVDGSVFPVAPGVAGGSFDPTLHEFVNFPVQEVESDLLAFLAKLKQKNPTVKILLTVSPVPLVATYEDRHVLVSTTYSKAVLRVAAEAATAQYGWVDYFPSYEIITGSFNQGQYYADDFREVNPAGVAHVMRCFQKHYIGAQTATPGYAPVSRDDVICDEEVIVAMV
jgi:hypothetical protein